MSLIKIEESYADIGFPLNKYPNMLAWIKIVLIMLLYVRISYANVNSYIKIA